MTTTTGEQGGRGFPIMTHRSIFRDLPQSVPWSAIEPHEAQALKNHDQSLEQLAKRGGLDPTEFIAVMEDRRWSGHPENADRAAALIKRLNGVEP